MPRPTMTACTPRKLIMPPGLAIGLGLFLAVFAGAQVLRLEVESRQAVLGGKPFGPAGLG